MAAPPLHRITRQSAYVALKRTPGGVRVSRQVGYVAGFRPAGAIRVSRQAGYVGAQNPFTTNVRVSRQSGYVAAQNPFATNVRVSRQAGYVAIKFYGPGTSDSDPASMIRITRQSGYVASRRLGYETTTPIDLPAVLPNAIWANWVDNVRIDTGYSTDITTAKITLAEERRSLKGRPDRILAARLTGMRPNEASKLWGNLMAIGDRRVPVPLFPDRTKLISHSGTTIFCDPTKRRFYPGARLMVHDFDAQSRPINIEYRNIVNVLSDRIIINTALSLTHPARARVVPCIDAEISLAHSAKWVSGDCFDGSLLFIEVPGKSALPPSCNDLPAGMNTYLGVPIWNIQLDGTDGPIVEGFRRAGEKYEQGRSNVVDVDGARPQVTFSLPVTCLDRDHFWKTLQFFDSRRGRRETFWLMAPNRKWRIVNLTTTYIEIEAAGNLGDIDSFVDYIGLKFRDGNIIIRGLASTGVSGSNWRLFFDTTITVPSATLIGVSSGHQVRFDTDAVSENWLTYDICKMEFTAFEVLEEKDVALIVGEEIVIITGPETIANLFLWIEAQQKTFAFLIVGDPGHPNYWFPSLPYPGQIGQVNWIVKEICDVRAIAPSNDPLPTPRLSTTLYSALEVLNNTLLNNGKRILETVSLVPGGPPPIGGFWKIKTGGNGGASNLGKIHDDILGMTIFIIGIPPFGNLFNLVNSSSSKILVWDSTQVEIYSPTPGTANPAHWITGLTIPNNLPIGTPTTMVLTWKPGVYLRVYRDGVLQGSAATPPATLTVFDETISTIMKGICQTFTGNVTVLKDAALGLSTFFDGLFIYQRALTNSELNAVGNYIKDQYKTPWTTIS